LIARPDYTITIKNEKKHEYLQFAAIIRSFFVKYLKIIGFRREIRAENG